ncbi:MAG TPA: hypothetical protein VNI84_05565 [Pyrinomonadaceae bacterium]|nr:hypothetical protein [Pyrinomonadaceae bacterium]
MKNLLTAILFTALLSLEISAQCRIEPTIAATGKNLKTLKVSKQAKLPAEFLLTLKASVPGASWQTKDAETAILTVFVDGKYNQDLILFHGEKPFEYQAPVGNLSAGEHKITIVLNEARSARNARNVKIQSAFAVVLEDSTADSKPANPSMLAHIARVNAPFIYARPDTIDKFSDIPLLTFYEIFDEAENVKRIRYTTIFTNEDGGTQSAALMARWGRMTDIEWVYEIRVSEKGGILSEIYQGANHEPKNFNGKRIFGSHPLFFNTTVNNNFSDAGCSLLRFSPMLVEANLANGSRETVMDNFAWTYQIMAREAMREGRVNPNKLGANTIDDPREYLYAEIYSEPENAAINVEAKTADGEKFTSDGGNKSLRVGRPGFARIALRAPQNRLGKFPKTVNISCYATVESSASESACRNVRLIKLVRLDRNYLPVVKHIDAASQSAKSGEKATF